MSAGLLSASPWLMSIRTEASGNGTGAQGATHASRATACADCAQSWAGLDCPVQLASMHATHRCSLREDDGVAWLRRPLHQQLAGGAALQAQLRGQEHLQACMHAHHLPHNPQQLFVKCCADIPACAPYVARTGYNMNAPGVHRLRPTTCFAPLRQLHAATPLLLLASALLPFPLPPVPPSAPAPRAAPPRWSPPPACGT